jgi:hypothetical protein
MHKPGLPADREGSDLPAAAPTLKEIYRGGVIDPGLRAVAVAAMVLVLLLLLALPHTGPVSGWEVLAGDGNPEHSITMMSRLFVWSTLLAAAGASALALLARRWILVLAAAAGTTLTAVLGVLAVWSRQTLGADQPGGGVGLGLALAVPASAALAYQLLRIASARRSSADRVGRR